MMSRLGLHFASNSDNSEKLIRHTLRRLSEQRIALVLQPGNVWVIEKAVEDDNAEIDAALKSAYIRGWVEPIANAVPTGALGPGGQLPTGDLRISPFWRLTDAGWAVVKRRHGWALFAILIALLSFAVSAGSLVISLTAVFGK
jgi:hypothetical protein